MENSRHPPTLEVSIKDVVEPIVVSPVCKLTQSRPRDLNLDCPSFRPRRRLVGTRPGGRFNKEEYPGIEGIDIFLL